MKIKIHIKELSAMLEWLGIILLAGLIIWWSFKKKKTGSCCSGCDLAHARLCPLECAGKNIESKEESAK